jgi:hypothetical protein
MGLTYGNGAAAWTSRDGIDWTPTSVGNAERATMLDVMAVPGGCVSVGLQREDTDFRPAVWRSSDGLKWEQMAAPASTTDGAMSAVAATNGVLVAIAGSATDAEAASVVWRSTDGGATWKQTYRAICCQRLSGIAGTPAGFVVSGTATDGTGTVALTSADGAKWDLAGPIASTSVDGLLQTQGHGMIAWAGSQAETNSVYSILFAPSASNPLSRDEAIAVARTYAGVDEAARVNSAERGPYGRFDLEANDKASPPPMDALVWQVIFRSGDGYDLRIVVLDAYSGELIETTAAIE